jgi:hypothetical protein
MFATLLLWAFIGLILAAAVDLTVNKNLKPTVSSIVFTYVIAVIVVLISSYLLAQVLPDPSEVKAKVPLFAKIVMLGIGAIAPFIRRWVVNLLKDRSA